MLYESRAATSEGARAVEEFGDKFEMPRWMIS